MRLKFFIVGVLLALPLLVNAQEQDISSGNVYRLGAEVAVRDTVDGDVYAVGNKIEISGHVTGDVFAVAESVTIDGVIDGNLRAVARQIIINGQVNRNVSFLADALTVTDVGRVGESLSGASTYCTLSGPIGRDVEGVYSTVILANSIGRNVKISLRNDFNSGLQILTTAEINGDVDYKAYRPATPAAGARINGGLYYQPIKAEVRTTQTAGLRSFGWWVWLLIRLAALYFMAWVFWKVGGKKFNSTVQIMLQQPGKCLWQGALLVIIVPIISLFLAVTLIGIPLSVILLILYLVGWFFFAPWAIWLLGRIISSALVYKRWQTDRIILLIGVLSFYFIVKLPYAGHLLYIFLLLLVWGALWQSWRKATDGLKTKK